MQKVIDYQNLYRTNDGFVINNNETEYTNAKKRAKFIKDQNEFDEKMKKLDKALHTIENLEKKILLLESLVYKIQQENKEFLKFNKLNKK